MVILCSLLQPAALTTSHPSVISLCYHVLRLTDNTHLLNKLYRLFGASIPIIRALPHHDIATVVRAIHLTIVRCRKLYFADLTLPLLYHTGLHLPCVFLADTRFLGRLPLVHQNPATLSHGGTLLIGLMLECFSSYSSRFASAYVRGPTLCT